MNYYGFEISHKKDPKATSFFTYKTELKSSQVKEVVEKSCSNVVVDKILVLRELPENVRCELAQGLYVLELNYSKRRKERIKERVVKLYERIIGKRNENKIV